MPHARSILERNTRDFELGKVTPDDYLGHLSDEAEASGSFRDALIRPDSIIGKTVKTYERRAVATADVSYVDSRRGWTERTAGGLTGLAVVGLVVAVIVGFTVVVFGSAAPASNPP